MTSRRLLKAAEAIREVVSMAILTEVRDPRVRNVTVTSVEVAPDMRQAKVRVSVMGDDTKQQLAIRGLESCAGFLQAKIGDRIDTRYTPKLRFELDQGVKKSIAIARMLAEVLPADDAEAPAAADGPARGETRIGEGPTGEEPSVDGPADAPDSADAADSSESSLSADRSPI